MSSNPHSGQAFHELILGGARSGKGRLAERLVQARVIVKACTGKCDLAV